VTVKILTSELCQYAAGIKRQWGRCTAFYST